MGALRYDLALLFATAVWSVTFVVVKDALALASPYALIAARFALAAAVAWAVGRGAWPTRAEWRAGAPLALYLFLGFAFQVSGLAHTSASRSGFITGLAVVLVPVFARVLLGARTEAATWIGAAIATAGLAGLSGAFTGEPAPPTLRGDVLTLGCAVAFALHILFAGRASARMRLMPGLIVQCAGTAVCAAILSPLVETPRLESDTRLWAALAFLALFPTVLTVAIQMWAQRHVPAARTALIFALEPVFAAAFSVAWGERLGVREVVGGALIVAGVVTAELPWRAWLGRGAQGDAA